MRTEQGLRFTRRVGRIERLRRERGLRQVDVAERAGVSKSYIAMVEQGWQPPARRQGSIATALGVEVDDLWPTEERR